MFARRQSNRLFSTLEQRLRTSRALMLHFFYPPCTSRENWVRTTTSFKLAIEIFSIRKTLISDHFDKLAFSPNKKFTDDVIFSHADTLTGCPWEANNIIKFRAYRRLLLSAAYVTRNLGVDEHGLFVVDEDFFIVCTRHAQIVFTRSSSVARALVSTPTCCNILQYIKRTKPSADR